MVRAMTVLTEHLQQHDVSLDHYLLDVLQTLVQALMELDVQGVTGAERHERHDDRQTYRNGYRRRTWQTTAGPVELAIPKLRRGSYYPAFLDREFEAELRQVALDALLHGSVDELVDRLLHSAGLADITADKQAMVTQQLDEIVSAFHHGEIVDQYAALFLDVLDVTVAGRQRQLVVAWGETADDERKLVACEIALLVDDVFWLDFLDSLEARGLAPVEMVICDSFAGVRYALDRIWPETSWRPLDVTNILNLEFDPWSFDEPLAIGGMSCLALAG
jgi:transposase-like protein